MAFRKGEEKEKVGLDTFFVGRCDLSAKVQFSSQQKTLDLTIVFI